MFDELGHFSKNARFRGCYAEIWRLIICEELIDVTSACACRVFHFLLHHAVQTHTGTGSIDVVLCLYCGRHDVPTTDAARGSRMPLVCS